MQINQQDHMWAHSIGVDMSDAIYDRRLKAELNDANVQITRLEFQLMAAKRSAAKWKRRWTLTFGLLMAALIVAEVLLAGKAWQ